MDTSTKFRLSKQGTCRASEVWRTGRKLAHRNICGIKNINLASDKITTILPRLHAHKATQAAAPDPSTGKYSSREEQQKAR